MNLPDDYSRCLGTDNPQCKNCRRREPVSKNAIYCINVAPHDFSKEEKCPIRIVKAGE